MRGAHPKLYKILGANFILSGIFLPVVSSQDLLEWPYYLPVGAKYFPEDEHLHRRDLKLARQRPGEDEVPHVVRMIGLDSGEKLYPGHWKYEHWQSHEEPTCDASQAGHTDQLPASNVSFSHRPPLQLHIHEQLYSDGGFIFGRGLRKRAFQCPANSFSCSSIGRPNLCCSQGETCNIIPDTGLGDVGCCPSAAANGCSGSLVSCNTGYTQCSTTLGGGCCIPQYICVDGGCAPGPALVSTVVVTPSPTTSSAPASSSTTTSSSTSTSRSSSSSSSSVYTGPQTTLSCSSGFRACPVGQGGGCCRTERDCGATDCPSPSRASSSAFIAPARPTNSAPVTSQASSSLPTYTGTVCPSAFYQCDAYLHGGGCCRVGRDCGLTSCPAVAYTTIVNSNGLTIVQPVGTAAGSGSSSGASARASSSQRSCPSSWIRCTNPDGCCPSNFACADRNQCTRTSGTVPSQTVVDRVALGSAVKERGLESSRLTCVLAVGIGVVLLI